MGALLGEKSKESSSKEVMDGLVEENKRLNDANKKFVKKIDFARKITEQKIVENISNDDYQEDPHLITVLSTTLDEDDFELDETEKDETNGNSEGVKNLRSKGKVS